MTSSFQALLWCSATRVGALYVSSGRARARPGLVSGGARNPVTRLALCKPFKVDLDAPLIGAFLDHLEIERGNTDRPLADRVVKNHSGWTGCGVPEDR